MGLDEDAVVLARSVREAILANASLDELFEIVRGYKSRGGSQEQAQEALQAARQGADEVTDDRILEVLDFVVGFCSPHRRIWD
jgi:hypothetical protein